MMKTLNIVVLLSLVAVIAGCNAKSKGAESAPEKAPEGAKVAKVVVLEQETGCECALARQEVTWTNLQAALDGMEKKPAVDVIHFDVEPDAAQPFQDMKAVMVVPALYFLDLDGKLVATEQGELTAEAIAALLAPKEGTDEG
jgi:hypothetical protein